MITIIKKFGNLLSQIGVLAMSSVATIGAVGLDLVAFPLTLLFSNAKSAPYNFPTSYLWQAIFANRYLDNKHAGRNRFLLGVGSFFLTAMTVGIAFLLGMPQFGMICALTWGASVGLVAVGQCFAQYAKIFETSPKPHNNANKHVHWRNPAASYERSYTNSMQVILTSANTQTIATSNNVDKDQEPDVILNHQEDSSSKTQNTSWSDILKNVQTQSSMYIAQAISTSLYYLFSSYVNSTAASQEKTLHEWYSQGM